MDYEIHLSESKKFYIIRFFVSITNQLSLRSALEAQKLGEAEGLNHFLYDVRSAPNIESNAANYFYVYGEMADFELDRSARVAILAAPDDTSHDFIATLSQNAGFNVHIFKNEGEAVAWLEKP